jgi:hypothetical protein
VSWTGAAVGWVVDWWTLCCGGRGVSRAASSSLVRSKRRRVEIETLPQRRLCFFSTTTVDDDDEVMRLTTLIQTIHSKGTTAFHHDVSPNDLFNSSARASAALICSFRSWIVFLFASTDWRLRERGRMGGDGISIEFEGCLPRW